MSDRDAIGSAIQCIHDLAEDKGGWAYEEVCDDLLEWQASSAERIKELEKQVADGASAYNELSDALAASQNDAKELEQRVAGLRDIADRLMRNEPVTVGECDFILDNTAATAAAHDAEVRNLALEEAAKKIAHNEITSVPQAAELAYQIRALKTGEKK